MNYITDDPTLKRTARIVALIWFVALSAAVAILMQPKSPNTLLKPIRLPMNGYMFNSNYIWGQIP